VNSQFLRNVLNLTSATALGQVLVLLALPFITRLYSPSDFGLFGLFTAVLSVFMVISALRYEVAIPLSGLVKDARLLILIAIVISSIFSLVILLVVIIIGDWIVEFSGQAKLKDYLLIFPIAVFIGSGYRIMNFWSIRGGEYNRIAKTKLLQSVSYILIQLSIGLMGGGVIGLILGHVIGQSVGFFTLAKNSEVLNSSRNFVGQKLRVIALLRRYCKFPKFDAPAALLDTASSQLPNLLLVFIFGPIVAGMYLLAERVLAAPMGIVGQAMGQVFYGDTRSLLANGSLGKRSLNMAVGMLIILLPIVIVVFICSEFFFQIIFGDSWSDAGLFASWLVFGVAAQLIYSPLSVILMATSGQKWNLYIHIVLLFFKCLALGISYYLDDPLIAVVGISFSILIIYGLSIIFILKRAFSFSKL